MFRFCLYQYCYVPTPVSLSLSLLHYPTRDLQRRLKPVVPLYLKHINYVNTLCCLQLFDNKIKITPPISILHCSIIRLCHQLDVHFANCTQQNLVTEWKDFFCPAVTNAVILQFKHILKDSKLLLCFSYFLVLIV